MNSEVHEVWRRANEIQAALEHWIEAKDGHHMHLRLSRENQLRILKLRTWSLRYYVSIEDILDMVVQILRDRVNVRKVRKVTRWDGIGVTIRALTGNGAERILVQELAERYPGNEHVAVWREQEKERQLLREQHDEDELTRHKEKSMVSYASAQQFINQYIARVTRKRMEGSNAATQQIRRRKAYRYNPWI